MSGVTDVATEEPRPVPDPESHPPQRHVSPGEWIRENLFSGAFNTVLTLVFAPLLAWAVFKAVMFVFFSSDWTIIEVNLTNFMVGRFPREQLPRLWVAIFIIATVIGVDAGASSRHAPPISWRRRTGRLLPPVVLVVVLLSFSRTILPTALALAAVVIAVIGYLGGRRLPDAAVRRLGLVSLAGLIAAYAVCTAFGGVGYDTWGGVLVTLFLAVGGITLSFPVGVALALGRRSSFPAVRTVCVAYIELIRGVPLITLLFMGGFMLGFFYPEFVPQPGNVTIGLVIFTMFTAAYVAEIVRGGLQGVSKGQTEAAVAIGLSPLATTRLIVLPQGLRNVIPALVGQFISLFKDTSLIQFLSVLDLLAVAQVVTQQPDFLAQGLGAQTLTFAGFVYWVFCYSMSRASQRLEQRLGVGER